MMFDLLTLDSAPDAPTPHSRQTPDESSDSLTPDSAPDALTRHSGPTFVGLDWERDGWRMSIAGSAPIKVTKADLLTSTLDEADLVIVEQAHMKPRNAYSVAQVYTQKELDALPFRDKVIMFPGMPGQLAKAARTVGNILRDSDGNPVLKTVQGTDYKTTVPDKELDAATMALYAVGRCASWRPLVRSQSSAERLWPARDALREDLREGLNPLRAAWNAKLTAEKYALPEVADFCALLDANFDALTDGVKEQFQIRRSRNGIRVEKMTPAITCYLAVRDRSGALRTRPDGKFIGVRFILDTIGMSGCYRPNMARSQLTHYGMRHYKGGRDGGHRNEYMRNLRNFLAFLRDASEPLTTDSAPDALTPHSDPGDNIDLLTTHSRQRSDSLTGDSALDALTPHSGHCETYKEAA